MILEKLVYLFFGAFYYCFHLQRTKYFTTFINHTPATVPAADRAKTHNGSNPPMHVSTVLLSNARTIMPSVRSAMSFGALLSTAKVVGTLGNRLP